MRYTILALFTFCSFVAGSIYYCNEDKKWGHPEPPAGYKLTKAIAFMRHGARAEVYPAKCFVGDKAEWNCKYHGVDTVEYEKSLGTLFFRGSMPGRSALPGSCFLGSLVEAGLEMGHNNGETLRNAYSSSGIIPGDPASPQSMWRSDKSPDVVKTGQAAVSALYGHNDSVVAPWVVLDDMVDTVLPNTVMCPGLKKERRTACLSPEAMQHILDTNEFREAMSNATGVAPPNPYVDVIMYVNYIYLTWECFTQRQCKTVPVTNREVPKGLEFGGKLFNQLSEEANWWLFQPYRISPTLLRMSVGPFLQDVLDVVVSDRTFAVYAGHDMGPISYLMHALLDQNSSKVLQLWPPFGAMIVMEIYEDSNMHRSVRFVYNGEVVSANVPSCAGLEMCGETDVKNLILSYKPSKKECPRYF